MEISKEIQDFYKNDVLDRFLRYVRVSTQSDDSSHNVPSTACQFDLLYLLEEECKQIGLNNISLSNESGYLYATLPANGKGEPFGLLAHVDTSPDQPGMNVKPVIHEKYDGNPILFPDDESFTLSIDDCPLLENFIGEDIITASGKTLLGADDKAGVAEIMAACATFCKYPDLPHPEIRICFTPDEEIGRGVDNIDLDYLPNYCYTVDGGKPGEVQDECFDAWRVDIAIKGVGVHPGEAKNRMVNAAAIACKFVSDLPEHETPEHTENREGFYHVHDLRGETEFALITLIVRDFDPEMNESRISLLESLASHYHSRFPGVAIEVTATHTYKNMNGILSKHPHLTGMAVKAIAECGLDVYQTPIRGGTDGSRLTEMGHPTPNLFAGGLLFHSKREWIAVSALEKGVEMLIRLSQHWTKQY